MLCIAEHIFANWCHTNKIPYNELSPKCALAAGKKDTSLNWPSINQVRTVRPTVYFFHSLSICNGMCSVCGHAACQHTYLCHMHGGQLHLYNTRIQLWVQIKASTGDHSDQVVERTCNFREAKAMGIQLIIKRIPPLHPRNMQFYIQKIPEMAMSCCLLEVWYLSVWNNVLHLCNIIQF